MTLENIQALNRASGIQPRFLELFSGVTPNGGTIEGLRNGHPKCQMRRMQ